jgi:hypothetical protein
MWKKSRVCRWRIRIRIFSETAAIFAKANVLENPKQFNTAKEFLCLQVVKN